jgi:hypothetical protein
VASWNLNSGFLKLFAWTGDFNPNLQKNTTAQVWVRIYGLSQEYWRPKILFAIVSSIGTPICTDAIAAKPMFDRTFGHYARVLVDLDISQTPRYQVLVERKGYAFFVDLEYENLPEFCSHCNMIGHYVEICKKVQGNVNYEEKQANEDREKNKQKGEPSKQYVKKKDGRLQNDKGNAVTTSNSQPVLTLQSPTVDIQPATEPIATINTNIVNLNQQNNSQPVLTLLPSTIGLQPVIPVTEPAADTNPVILTQQNKFSALAELAFHDHIEIDEPILSEVGRHAEPVMNALVRSEVEVIEDLESPSESEFVAYTPPIVNKDPSEDLSLQIVRHEQSQNRIHHDMQFLRESWANLAENEEQQHKLLEDLEADPDSRFTVVTSRASKKAAAKLSTSKSTYGTRSKVGPKKTFK